MGFGYSCIIYVWRVLFTVSLTGLTGTVHMHAKTLNACTQAKTGHARARRLGARLEVLVRVRRHLVRVHLQREQAEALLHRRAQRRLRALHLRAGRLR